jgi:chemotaxis protein methyltransferase CheR
MTALFNRTDIDRFRAILAVRFGFHYEDSQLDILADILRARMQTTGSARFEHYAERLTSPPLSFQELRALAEHLAVGETFFFRNADNFRAFAEHVLPERVRVNRPEKRLRILSAGCASGEEPYSLAIVLREAFPDLGSWDVKITGIDINPSMLRKAVQARYSAWSLRAVPEDVRCRYFRADGVDFVLDPKVQKMVTFEERNVLEEDPLFWQSPVYDVIFCRNVIMYFTPEAMRKVVRHIGQSLLPGGFLFLGHAETLRGLSHEFHLCHTHDTFYYQKRESSRPPVLAATSPGFAAHSVADADTLAVVETTASWVDAIQNASDRIARLAGSNRSARSPNPSTASGPALTPPGCPRDLGVVLEAMRQERFSDALDILSALPPESHDEPDALLLRAVLLTNSSRLEEAEAACARLLALDDLNAGAHYVMALCREHAGDSAGAIEHDQTAIYLDAGFAMPHLHLGLMARRSGDRVTAQRELSQALILLGREDTSRLLLFGGGFSRDTLVQLCRTQLRAAEGD